jgi:hypothetical protein
MKNKKINKEELIEPILGAQDYLDKLVLKKDLIIEPLDREEYGKAFKEFNNMIDGIDVLNNLLINIKAIADLKLANLYYKNESLLIRINDFNKFLSGDLIESMKNEDYQLISDLLEYEFNSYINRYKEVFIYLEKYFKEKYN